MLALFWDGHDPTAGGSSQYRAELFCDDDDQLAAARRSAADWERRQGRKIATKIERSRPFHPAEAYHQKWRLRRQPRLFDALQSHYASEPELLASVAAAKLNGYVGVAVDPAVLRRDLPRLGLAPDMVAELESTLRR